MHVETLRQRSQGVGLRAGKALGVGARAARSLRRRRRSARQVSGHGLHVGTCKTPRCEAEGLET